MKKKKEKGPESLIVLYKGGSYEIIPEKDYHYQKNQQYVIVPHIVLNIGGGILLKPTEFWDFDEVELTMELCARNYDFDDIIKPEKDDEKWIQDPELYENLNSTEKVLSRTTFTYTSIIEVMNALHSIYKLRYMTKIYNEADDNGYLYTTIEISYVRIIVKREKNVVLDLDCGIPLLLNLSRGAIDCNKIIKAIKPFYNSAKLGDDFVFKMKNHEWDFDLMMKTTHHTRDMKGFTYLWYLKETNLCYPLDNIEFLNMRKDLHQVYVEMLIDPEAERVPKEATVSAWHKMEETETYWAEVSIILTDAAAVFEFSRYVNYFFLTMKVLFDDFVFDLDPVASEVYFICKAEISRDQNIYMGFDERNITPDDFWYEYVYMYLDGLPFK